MKVLKYLSCFFILLTVQPIYPQNISWDKTNGPYGGYISAIYQSASGKIYASGRGVIYSKYSGDLRWDLVLRTNTNSFASTIVENSTGEVFVSFGIGTYRSGNNGVTWQLMNSGISGLAINKLTINEQDYLYTTAVISSSFKIFRSVDNGSSWEEVYEYSPATYDYSIIESGEDGLILVGLYYHIFRSTNYGQNWENITYPNLGNVSNILIMDNGQAFVTEGSIEIWKSTDYGASWFVLGVTPTFHSISFIKNDSSNNLYLGMYEHYTAIPSQGLGGVYKSTDEGLTWINLTFDLINREVLSIEFVNDNKIWVGTYGKGVQELIESDSTWVDNNIGMTDIIITSITFDMLNRVWVSTSRGGIFFSTDAGNSWIERSKGLVWPTGYEIRVSDNNDIFLVDHLGVYRYDSTNVTWVKKLTLGYSNDGTKSVEIKDHDTIFVGSLNSGIAVSYDNGETWDWNPPYYSFVHSFEVLNDRSTLAGGAKIYRSTNNGISWETFFVYNNYTPTDIEQTNLGYLLVSYYFYDNNPPTFDGKLLLSTDNGQSWTSIADSINPYIYCITPYTNNRIFIGTKNGVYLTTNYGNEWQQLNDGLDNLYIHALAFDKDGYVYAGTEEGLYKSNSNVITDVYKEELPDVFYLSQNYPNPFNPTTNIKFQIPALSFVTLKVYDVLGNEITTLVSEEKSAGSYEVEFDGTGIVSGVYFYQIRAGNFVETKKMVLLK